MIFDLAGFGMKTMNYDAVASLVNYLTYQYPYVVERVIIVNAPWIFNTCWGWIKGLIPAAAGDIVNFVNSWEEMEEFVLKENVPNTIKFE